jgi:chemotaxis protein MotB
LIEGHTDAQPYASDNGYTNWELSSDRANSARRLLQQDGIGPNQISQVRGYADQMLRVPSNPLDPSNRRISLIVQWVDAASVTQGPAQQPGKGVAANKPLTEAAENNPGSVPATTDPSSTGAKPGPVQQPASSAAPGKQPATAATPGKALISRIKNLIPGTKK